VVNKILQLADKAVGDAIDLADEFGLDLPDSIIELDEALEEWRHSKAKLPAPGDPQPTIITPNQQPTKPGGTTSDPPDAGGGD